MEDLTEFKIRDSLDVSYTFFTDIVSGADLDDARSLYLYGENVDYNEIKSFEYIGSLSEEDIDRIANAYVNGYIKSFELAGIDLSKKQTVQIRFPVGFERIIRRALRLFEENNLKPLILRGSSQTGSIDINPQFAYDHRYDEALYYNKAVKERKILVTKKAYDKYVKEADVYAGPAVFEYFGEEKFEPAVKASACALNDEQQKLYVSQRIELAALRSEERRVGKECL